MKVPRSTSDLVRRVKQGVDALPSVYNHILDAMNEVAVLALDLLTGETGGLSRDHHSTDKKKSDDYDATRKLNKIMVLDASSRSKLGELVRVNHGLLNTINVSHESLETVVKVGSRYNFPTKLTGAGN